MAALKAGCAGFPIGRERYFGVLSTVELDSTFEKMPKLSTLQAIRAEAPKDFEFSVRAPRRITHAPELADLRQRSRVGHFRDTPEVGLAAEELRAAADALQAKFVVFEIPGTFFPDADHLRDLYRFFKNLRRGKFAPVIQTKNWPGKLVSKVCGELGLIAARDPLDHSGEDAPAPLRARPSLNYFRLRGGPTGSYGDGELEEIRKACRDVPSYVYFTNRLNSFRDARRLIAGAALRR